MESFLGVIMKDILDAKERPLHPWRRNPFSRLSVWLPISLFVVVVLGFIFLPPYQYVAPADGPAQSETIWHLFNLSLVVAGILATTIAWLKPEPKSSYKAVGLIFNIITFMLTSLFFLLATSGLTE